MSFLPLREGGAEGGVLHIMHGRSRMTIDPRIPTKPGDEARRISTDQEGGCYHVPGTWYDAKD